jgi:hypothetical protein
MRSTGQFKVPGSRVQSFGNTKRIQLEVGHRFYQTNPFLGVPSVQIRKLRNEPIPRSPGEVRNVRSIRNHLESDIYTIFTKRSHSEKMEWDGMNKMDRMQKLRNEPMRSARQFKVRSSRFNVLTSASPRESKLPNEPIHGNSKEVRNMRSNRKPLRIRCLHGFFQTKPFLKPLNE